MPPPASRTSASRFTRPSSVLAIDGDGARLGAPGQRRRQTAGDRRRVADNPRCHSRASGDAGEWRRVVRSGGRDVILYNVVRPYDVRVAKATIQTKNSRALVGGTALGVQFFEVVNHMFMRNAVLPRPYEGVTTIVEARGRCIAWPHDRMRDDKKSLQHSKGGGTGRPSQLEDT